MEIANAGRADHDGYCGVDRSSRLSGWSNLRLYPYPQGRQGPLADQGGNGCGASGPARARSPRDGIVGDIRHIEWAGTGLNLDQASLDARRSTTALSALRAFGRNDDGITLVMAESADFPMPRVFWREGNAEQIVRQGFCIGGRCHRFSGLDAVAQRECSETEAGRSHADAQDLKPESPPHATEHSAFSELRQAREIISLIQLISDQKIVVSA